MVTLFFDGKRKRNWTIFYVMAILLIIPLTILTTLIIGYFALFIGIFFIVFSLYKMILMRKYPSKGKVLEIDEKNIIIDESIYKEKYIKRSTVQKVYIGEDSIIDILYDIIPFDFNIWNNYTIHIAFTDGDKKQTVSIPLYICDGKQERILSDIDDILEIEGM